MGETPDKVLSDVKANPCLEAVEIDGKTSIQISDGYIDKLEGIAAAVKCIINMKACAPFGRPEGSSFDDGSAMEIAAEAGGAAAQRMQNNYNQSVREQAEVTEFYENVLAEIKTRISTDGTKFALETSYGEIEQILQTLIALKVFDVRQGLVKGIYLKATMVGKNKAVSALTKTNKKYLGEMVEAITEIAKKDRRMLDRIARGRGTRDAVNLANRLNDITAVTSQMPKAQISMAAKATGYAAALGAFMAVSVVMEMMPVVLDISDGERDSSLIEDYKRCDAPPDTVTAGGAATPYMYSAENNYYDGYRPRYKGQPDDPDAPCPPMLWLNFQKFPNLATLSNKLIVDHTKNPVICSYVNAMAERLQVDNDERKRLSPKITCPVLTATDIRNRERSIKVEFGGDFVSSLLLGSPVNYNYKVDSQGKYRALSLTSPTGFTPKLVKRMEVKFKGINLNPDFARKGPDVGRTVDVETCTHNIKVPRVFKRGCFPPKPGSKNALYTTEKGLEDSFSGISDQSGVAKKLFNAQKQLAGYSQMVLARSRFLNRSIEEAGFCCEQQEKGWPGDSNLRTQCEDRYRLSQPETVSVDSFETGS